ncbi:hypothetical protein V6N13_149182 [Hibiscus sabdariffa]|uniref:Histone deacetylase complex subunit SAP30 Sin3 binding domain-containing protein n=1 Tax=Hibiscus sabdariffa TaxID=183260 RepID=A0ABR2EI22_9ROSI
MSTNNMGNHNGDASKNKGGSRSNVELGSYISSFLKESVDEHCARLNLDLSLGLANRETDLLIRTSNMGFDSVVDVIFDRDQLLSEQKVILDPFQAEEDVPTHEHAEGVLPDLKKPSPEAEHNGRSLRKTISDFAMKDVKPDSSRGLELRFGTQNFEESKHVKPDSSREPGLELGTGNFKESEHAKIPSVPMYEHAEGKTISDFKTKDVKTDSSRRQGLELQLQLGTGNIREWHVKNPPVTVYEHAEGKTISDFKMKAVKPDSSSGSGLALGLGIGNFEEWHAKNPPVPLYGHAKGKTVSDFKMKDVEPDPSRRHKLGLGTVNFEEGGAKNPPVPMYEHAKGKTTSDIKMKDVKTDSSSGSGQGLGRGTKNFKSENPKVPQVPMCEHAKGKTISDFKMKDVKPVSSRGQRLGPVTKNFLGSENAKIPPVPMFDQTNGKTISGFKMKYVKPVLSSRRGLGTGNFESANVKNPPTPTCEHIEGKKIKDVKPDSSREQGLRLRFRLGTGNSREWHVKNPPVPMYEHAKGKTISDFKMKDVKPDSSGGQRIGPVTENFKRWEPGKNCPVPRKDGHCLSGDVSIYKHAEGNAEDKDQDVITTTCGFKTKDIKSERGKNSRVYKQEGCCSRRDVSKQEHAAKLKVNLATLGTDSLRRYIKYFKIEGTNPPSSRETILNAVQLHFASQQQLDEQQVIPEFVMAVRKIRVNL